MRFFKQNVIYAEKVVRRLETERDELKARLEAQDATVWNLQQDLQRAKSAAPPTHDEIATALQRVLPSVTAAAGFAQLRTAPDAPAFAQGILSLLQTARAVGRREALEPHPED